MNMSLLNWQRIKKYNYKETRLNVDVFMDDFNESFFKYINITPKSLCSKLKDVVVDFTKSNTSYIEQYVERKDEAEREYLEKLDNILNILDNLNAQEQYFIKGTYFHELSESAIRDKLQVSKNGMDHVKQSAIIKFALAFNLAEEKENRK